MSTALGMIETSGWVALIQAADAMVKSADVQLLVTSAGDLNIDQLYTDQFIV